MNTPLIERLPREQRSGTPLLLAPGAFCGTWVWEDRFLGAFADAGFRSYAMQFRGHGGSWLGRQRFGLEDYVDDLEAAISRLPARPVLVAHSLGALAAVRLLTRSALPGVVLMAPVPPDGVHRSMLRLARTSPASVAKLASLAIYPPVRHLGEPPVGMYSPRLEPAEQSAITRRLAGESTRALLESLLPVRIDDRVRSTPIHVIGAEGDAVIAPTDVRRCARRLGASFEMLPGRSHMLMAEPGWQQVTSRIVRWIESTVGDPTKRAPACRRHRQERASA